MLRVFSKFILLAFVMFSSSAFAELQSTCIKDLMNSMFQSKIEFKKNTIELTEVPTAEGVLRYPKNIDRVAHPDGHLMYGFESEYTKKETAQILEIYGPAPEYNISKEQWLAKTSQERMRWLEVHLGNKPVNATDSGLVKIVTEPGYEFLPNTLVYDSTGNVEFVLPPVNTLEQWEKEIRLINKRFGTGSMQGMITTPKEAFFKSSKLDAVESLKANTGWMAFTHEMDAISTLETGVQKLDKLALRNTPVVPKFQHPYLGPLTAKKQERLNQFMAANADGAKFEPHNLEKIKTREGSFKYIGSTAYRPDIGGSTRVGFEIRDAHKGTETLIDKMVKNTFYLQENRDDFRVFSNLKAFDSMTDFEKFTPEVKKMLKDVFPTTAIPGIVYDEENRIATEVYRNFAYPMRDWEKVVDEMPGLNNTQKEAYLRKIKSAQSAYVRKLESASASLNPSLGERIRSLSLNAKGSKEQAAIDIQKAVAEFSTEAAIGPMFQSWHAETVISNPAWNTHLNSVLEEIQPFKKAYAETIWGGSIDERVVQLQEKWPSNITVVEAVKFKSAKLMREGSKKVVGISLKGLSKEDEVLLLKDYTDAVSKGTVSFPLGENAGHLHTRLGDKDLDFWSYSNLTSSDYRFPSTFAPRLEPIVSLTADEELKLRTLVDVSDTNGFNSLGGVEEFGAPSSQTKGTIIDNKPLLDSEKHNCTTWICTARIGSENQALHELVGAKVGFNIYSNPGWWNTYLVAGAKHSEKIPYVVYIERGKDLSEMTDILQKAKRSNFKWNFGER
jgi:hypothetical protein